MNRKGCVDTDSATAPLQVPNPFSRREIDVFERRLFDVAIIEVKARRTVAITCNECGKRGYCARSCRKKFLRGATVAIEFELRWAYVARLVFAHGVVRELAAFVRVEVPMR